MIGGKAGRVVRGLYPYMHRHRRWFAKGTAAAVALVVFRLALPWPLRTLTQAWAGQPDTTVDAGFALLMGGAVLGLLLAHGLADLLERLYFARFAIGTMRDLRATVFRRAVRQEPQYRRIGSGDLVARLVGDTARVQAGLKGFFVHVATNGLMFLGVTAVLLAMHLYLGLVFGAAGLAAAGVALWGARQIFRASLRYRKKEGKLANAIQAAVSHGPGGADFARINRSSGRHRAEITRLQGLATWATHGIFGVSIVAALWIGTRAIAAGELAAGDMVVFIFYALMMRGPIVRLARQGARTGKILGTAHRLFDFLDRMATARAGDTGAALPPLREELYLAGVTVNPSDRHGEQPRLGPIDLRIPAGQTLVVVGDPGSGKTTLLTVLARLTSIDGGAILWDGQEISARTARSCGTEIAFAPQQSVWPGRPLRQALELPDAGVSDAQTAALLRRCGAEGLVQRLPGGLEARIGSDHLSPGECQMLSCVRLLGRPASCLLVDEPTSALPKSAARQVMRALLSAPVTTTVIVAAARPPEIGWFDRVIELRAGSIAFDGSPEAWRQARHLAPVPIAAAPSARPTRGAS